MRLFHVVCAASFSVGAAFAAEPAGVYSFPEGVGDAQACAHACDEDGLCMSWVFQGAGKCGLSAVAQAPNNDATVITGISAHAPRFMRRPAQFADAAQPAAPAEITTPAEVAVPAEDAPVPTSQALDDIGGETALLGGPDAGTIRSRLR